jgi:hypothetical protein
MRPKSLAEFDVGWLTDAELRKRLPPLVRAIAEDIRGEPFHDEGECELVHRRSA